MTLNNLAVTAYACGDYATALQYKESSGSFRLVKPQNMKPNFTEVIKMKVEYDLSKMKSRRNPYAARLKRQVTLRLGNDVREYFKTPAEETGIPYQSLMNLYLRDCAASHRTLKLEWTS